MIGTLLVAHQLLEEMLATGYEFRGLPVIEHGLPEKARLIGAHVDLDGDLHLQFSDGEDLADKSPATLRVQALMIVVRSNRELAALQQRIADSAAEATLEGVARWRTIDGVEWMGIDGCDSGDVANELRYLDLRDVLVRHPKENGLVRLDWSKGAVPADGSSSVGRKGGAE